jgi:hypothetical protein
MTGPTALNRRRRARTLVLALAVVAMAGCGVAAESDANRVPPDAVPFGLLDDQVSTTVAAGSTEQIYLVVNDRLVAVDRTLPVGGTPAELLGLVVDGPAAAEEELGITTAVPTGTIAAVDEDRGVAVVDLTAEFGDIRSADQPLALAQIVYTLTAQPGIGGVRFTLEGQDIEVPLPDGTSAETLARDDLDDFAPT